MNSQRIIAQKVCGVCKGEKEVRFDLDETWQEPSEALEAIGEVIIRNQKVFEFEKKLENQLTLDSLFASA